MEECLRYTAEETARSMQHVFEEWGFAVIGSAIERNVGDVFVPQFDPELYGHWEHKVLVIGETDEATYVQQCHFNGGEQRFRAPYYYKVIAE